MLDSKGFYEYIVTNFCKLSWKENFLLWTHASYSYVPYHKKGLCPFSHKRYMSLITHRRYTHTHTHTDILYHTKGILNILFGPLDSLSTLPCSLGSSPFCAESNRRHWQKAVQWEKWDGGITTPGFLPASPQVGGTCISLLKCADPVGKPCPSWGHSSLSKFQAHLWYQLGAVSYLTGFPDQRLVLPHDHT